MTQRHACCTYEHTHGPCATYVLYVCMRLHLNCSHKLNRYSRIGQGLGFRSQAASLSAWSPPSRVMDLTIMILILYRKVTIALGSKTWQEKLMVGHVASWQGDWEDRVATTLEASQHFKRHAGADHFFVSMKYAIDITSPKLKVSPIRV
jgi:hypothetical protein